MAEIILNDTQKQARKLLANLRSDRSLSYKETLQEILSLLGSNYKVPSSDIAKGMLAAMIENTFDYSNFRNILFMALCLSREYSMNTAAARRRAYLEDFGVEFYGAAEVVPDTVRKDEDEALERLIFRISQKIEQHGADYIDALLHYAKENRIISSYCSGSWHYHPVELCHYSRNPLPAISKREVELDKVDEKLADSIRFRIEAGEKDLDTSNFIMPWFLSMADTYYLKYHDHHGLYASITLAEYTDYEVFQVIKYNVTISQIVDGGILDIESTCDQNGLDDLLSSYDNPVLTYNSTCGPDPTNTFEALISIPGSVVFHNGKIRKATDEDPDEYEGLGLNYPTKYYI